MRDGGSGHDGVPARRPCASAWGRASRCTPCGSPSRSDRAPHGDRHRRHRRPRRHTCDRRQCNPCQARWPVRAREPRRVCEHELSSGSTCRSSLAALRVPPRRQAWRWRRRHEQLARHGTSGYEEPVGRQRRPALVHTPTGETHTRTHAQHRSSTRARGKRPTKPSISRLLHDRPQARLPPPPSPPLDDDRRTRANERSISRGGARASVRERESAYVCWCVCGSLLRACARDERTKQRNNETTNTPKTSVRLVIAKHRNHRKCRSSRHSHTTSYLSHSLLDGIQPTAAGRISSSSSLSCASPSLGSR